MTVAADMLGRAWKMELISCRFPRDDALLLNSWFSDVRIDQLMFQL